MNKTVGMYGGKFLIPHLGHLYSMTMASTIVDELHIIVSYDTVFEQEVLFKDAKVSHVHYKQRVRWWKELTKDMSHVYVHAVEETNNGEFSSWQEGAIKIKRAIGKDITHVFSSEHEYTEYFDILYPTAEHIVVDSKRSRYPISATKIRNEGVFENWDMIPKVVQRYFVKKVVIVGTESTGKSTLVKNLANMYNTNYVEEHGRTFYEELGDYETLYDDFNTIAYRQKYFENEALKDSNKLLFIDTEAIVTKRFLNQYLDSESEVLDAIIKSQKYDLWIFLNEDVEWVDDGTRVFGDDDIRKKGTEDLKRIMYDNDIDFINIHGNYFERMIKCRAVIDRLL